MPRARKTPGSINPAAPSSPGGKLPSTPTGLAYGENKKLADAQAAIPVAPQPGAGPAVTPPAATLAAAQAFTPPRLGLGDPTSRPNEDVMTGMDHTPQPPGAPSDIVMLLRGLYSQFPFEGVRELLEDAERGA